MSTKQYQQIWMIVNQILCSSLCKDGLNGLEDDFSVESAQADNRSSPDIVQIQCRFTMKREREKMLDCGAGPCKHERNNKLIAGYIRDGCQSAGKAPTPKQKAKRKGCSSTAGSNALILLIAQLWVEVSRWSRLARRDYVVSNRLLVTTRLQRHDRRRSPISPVGYVVSEDPYDSNKMVSSQYPAVKIHLHPPPQAMEVYNHM